MAINDHCLLAPQSNRVRCLRGLALLAAIVDRMFTRVHMCVHGISLHKYALIIIIMIINHAL